MLPDVVEEALERRGSAGTSDQTAMQADRHHAGPTLAAFAVEHVEAVLQVAEELVAAVEPLGRREAHVVGVKRVGHDQLLASADALPVGQLIRIGIGQIEEAALLGPDLQRVFRGAALIEAERPGAGDGGVQANRFVDVGLLGRIGMVAVVDPFQTVAGDLPARFVHGRHRLGMARHGAGHAIDGDRHVAGREHPPQPPEAHPRAVFVDRLHVDVALARPWRRSDDLREEGLRGGVAMQDVVLAAFLVVDDELHGDARAARPICGGRVAPVTDHVARVGLVEVEHGSAPPVGREAPR